MELTIKVPYIDRAVDHIKRHKTEYIVGTSVVVTAGVTFLLTRRFAIQAISVAPVFNNMPTFNNDNSSLVNFGGHATKIIKRMSDGEMWAKVTEAAEEAGVSTSFMSRHINGHEPDVYGEIYKIVGVGTTG